jgi:hypothetical protein
VYNEDERTSLVRSGAVTSDRVVVVGCPRMDPLHQARLERSDPSDGSEGEVVLFSIDVNSGAWTPFDGRRVTGAPQWSELARLVDRAFIECARAMPGRDFVIKSKVGMEQQQVDRLPQDLPANVRVMTGGVGTRLLTTAGAVVAFNSTVLLEAIASGVPTLMPRFAEASTPGAERWIFDLEGAVTVVADPERLADAIDAALLEGPTRELSPGAVVALERYVGNADGGAGARAWAFLLESLI